MRQLMLVKAKIGFTVYGIEFSYGQNTPYRSMVYKFGSVAQIFNHSLAVVGYESAVLPGELAVHIALSVKWPLISETGEALSEGAMNVRSIMALSDAEGQKAHTGKIRLMDEGTGRVLLFVKTRPGHVFVSELM